MFLEKCPARILFLRCGSRGRLCVSGLVQPHVKACAFNYV